LRWNTRRIAKPFEGGVEDAGLRRDNENEEPDLTVGSGIQCSHDFIAHAIDQSLAIAGGINELHSVSVTQGDSLVTTGIDEVPAESFDLFDEVAVATATGYNKCPLLDVDTLKLARWRAGRLPF
jgi:hypothetical protein